MNSYDIAFWTLAAAFIITILIAIFCPDPE